MITIIYLSRKRYLKNTVWIILNLRGLFYIQYLMSNLLWKITRFIVGSSPLSKWCDGSHFLNYYNNRSTERNKKDFFFLVWQAIKCTMVQQNEWVPVQKGNFLCTRRLTAEIMELFTNIFFCVANNKIVGQWSLLKCIINKEINHKKKKKGK